MTTRHLSETELQQYALDGAAAPKEYSEHIAVCENCRAEAMTYRSLFAAIKEQPEPAFDFDIAGLVLSQLPGGVPGELQSGMPAARRPLRKWTLST